MLGGPKNLYNLFNPTHNYEKKHPSKLSISRDIYMNNKTNKHCIGLRLHFSCFVNENKVLTKILDFIWKTGNVSSKFLNHLQILRSEKKFPTERTIVRC
jgi:hypothetical protein